MTTASSSNPLSYLASRVQPCLRGTIEHKLCANRDVGSIEIYKHKNQSPSFFSLGSRLEGRALVETHHLLNTSCSFNLLPPAYRARRSPQSRSKNGAQETSSPAEKPVSEEPRREEGQDDVGYLVRFPERHWHWSVNGQRLGPVRGHSYPTR